MRIRRSTPSHDRCASRSLETGVTMRLRKLALLVLIGYAMAAQAGTMASLTRLVHDGYGHKARLLIRPLLIREPADAQLIKLYAQALLTDQRFRKAFPYIKKLVHENPRDASDWLIYAVGLFAKSSRGGVFTLLGTVGHIHRVLEKAVRVAPKDMAARVALMQFDFEAPGILGGSDRQGQAERRVIDAHDPTQGQLTWASVLWSRGHRNQAIANIQQAIAKQPSSTSARLALAQDELALALRDRKKKRLQKDARAAFQKAWRFYRTRAVRGEPRRLDAFYRMGMIASMAGIHRQAGLQALQYYLTRVPPDPDPSPAWAHYRLGLLWGDLDHIHRARAQFRIALSGTHQRKLQKRRKLIRSIKRALARLAGKSLARSRG